MWDFQSTLWTPREGRHCLAGHGPAGFLGEVAAPATFFLPEDIAVEFGDHEIRPLEPLKVIS